MVRNVTSGGRLALRNRGLVLLRRCFLDSPRRRSAHESPFLENVYSPLLKMLLVASATHNHFRKETVKPKLTGIKHRGAFSNDDRAAILAESWFPFGPAWESD